ncbi:ABC transporter permease [Litoricolaceae bacterium]|nr:ABC transporter permease [Litorivicinaceae bacterium]
MIRIQIALIRLALLVLTIACWELISYSGLFYKEVFPSITTILSELTILLQTSEFYGHTWVTLFEVGAGLFFAISLGGVTGIIIGSSHVLHRGLDPILVALATTPKIIFFPIIMLLVGIGVESKIAMGALSAYFPICLSTAAGIRSVPQVFIDSAKSFGVSRLQLIRFIYFPAVLPELLTGVRLGLGVCIIGVLLGEIKISNQGLGFMAIEYYNMFNVPALYASLIVIFGMAVVINLAIDFILSKAVINR